MARCTFTLTLWACGAVELGLWCDRCLLPSAGRQRFLVTNDRDALVGRGEWAGCLDCGATDSSLDLRTPVVVTARRR